MKKVFISYSTKDREVAAKVKARLEAAGIAVTIDSESMPAGGNIRAFIDKSIRETDVTLSIVSQNSLESDWVAIESIESFAAERYQEGKKFIACDIDGEIHRNEFLNEALERINQEIKQLEKEIARAADSGVNAVNLERKKTRKYDLRNNLSKILDRLSEYLTLDIREPVFETSLDRIVAEIKKGASVPTSRNPGDTSSPHNPEEHLRYYDECDRREQTELFRNAVAAYLRLPTYTRPLIFFIHGGKSGAFDNIFQRLTGELRDELQTRRQGEVIEKQQWKSPPKPGQSQEAICQKYVQAKYNAHGMRNDECRRYLEERLRAWKGGVPLFYVKWSADEILRKPAEAMAPLISFAESWYGLAPIPVIWLIGIDYGSVNGPKSFFSKKFGQEKKIREWLQSYDVESLEKWTPDRPITLRELHEVTINDVDEWMQRVPEKLGFDTQRMIRLRKDVDNLFDQLKRSAVDMNTLIEKLIEFTA